MESENNYAFIDEQNLYLTLKKQLRWTLDHLKFRTYLRDKFGVKNAYLFIGYLDTNQDLYKLLQEAGYILIFKPTLKYRDGTIKGNCDAELVLQAMIEYPNYDKAVIISGDGDFYCLADYLIKNEKLHSVVIPNQHKYSALLKKLNKPHKKYLYFLNDQRTKLEYYVTK